MTEPEAETHWLDEHRNPTEAAVVRSLAAQVVAQHGGDLSGMRRALGYSNASWVGGGLAVRIANASVVDAGMAAEVALVRALPPEVGHPRSGDERSTSYGSACGLCTTPPPRSVRSSDPTRASYRQHLTTPQPRPIASVLCWI